MRRITVVLVVAFLLVPGGCLDDDSPSPQAGTDRDSNATDVGNGTAVNTAESKPSPESLNRSFSLDWTHVRAYRGQPVEDNCVFVFGQDALRIVDGSISVKWDGGRATTTPVTELYLIAGKNLDRYRNETDIAPGEYNINVDGWNLTNRDFPIHMIVGFRAPDPAYVGISNHAEVELNWTYRGTLEALGTGECAQQGLEE